MWIGLFHNLVIAAYTNIYMIKITDFAIINIVIFESCIYTYIYIYIYIYMRRFREYTSNRHNISVALDPHGMLK